MALPPSLTHLSTTPKHWCMTTQSLQTVQIKRIRIAQALFGAAQIRGMAKEHIIPMFCLEMQICVCMDLVVRQQYPLVRGK